MALDKVYKILILCGAGVATSVFIKTTLEQEFKKRDINADIRVRRIDQLPISQPVDLYVSGGFVPEDLLGGVPHFQSISFFTGMGIDSALDKIVEILKSK